MVKIFSIALVLIACVLNVSAFSTYRTPSSLVHNRITSAHIQKLATNVVINKDTSLQMAAAEATKSEPKKSLIDTVWNEDTKLGIYLAVWYIGNIACKVLLIFAKYNALKCLNYDNFNPLLTYLTYITVI